MVARYIAQTPTVGTFPGRGTVRPAPPEQQTETASMTRMIAALALAGTFALAGCENGPTKQDFGTLLGGIGGAAIGSQIGGGTGTIVAVAAGTLLGSFLGREVGRSLDKADLAAAEQAQQRAYGAPIGETITWNNPDTGNAGTVTPVRDGYGRGGAYCREYQQTVTIGGKAETAHGTACRQADGSWKVVS